MRVTNSSSILQKLKLFSQYSLARFWPLKLFILIILTVCILCYAFYVTYTNNIKDKLKEEANLIDMYLTTAFQVTHQLSRFIENQIVNGDYKNPQYISQIFHNLNNIEVAGMRKGVNWPSIGWVDANGKLIVHQLDGILQNPIDVKDKTYFQEGRVEPGKLKFIRPEYNILIKNDFVLPAGFGVIDLQGNFAGALSLTIAISALIEDIKALSLNGIKFIICDDKQNVFLASNIALINKYQNIHHIIGDDIESIGITNILSLDDDVYLYAKRSSMLPMIIFVGFNSYKFWMQILQNLGLLICGFVVVGLICVLLMVYASSIMIKMIGITEKAQKQFSKDINSKYGELMLDIATNCQEISQITSTLPKATKKKVEDILQKISHYTWNPNSFFNYVEFQKVNLNLIIHDAIQIKYNDILVSGATIKTSLSKDLPEILADPLVIKKVIISIISNAIEFATNTNFISIKTYTKKSDQGVKLVHMVFEDMGLGLNDEDMTQIRNKIGTTNSHYEASTNATFQEIAQLIEINNGKCYVKHNFGNGSLIHAYFTSYEDQNKNSDEKKKDSKKNPLTIVT